MEYYHVPVYLWTRSFLPPSPFPALIIISSTGLVPFPTPLLSLVCPLSFLDSWVCECIPSTCLPFTISDRSYSPFLCHPLFSLLLFILALSNHRLMHIIGMIYSVLLKQQILPSSNGTPARWSESRTLRM